MPSLNISTIVRVLRFGFIIAAGFLGLFGVLALLSLFTFQLCAQRSFGVPYLSPIAPLTLGDLKDTIVRAPAWMLNQRPRLTGYREPQRQHTDLQPRPPLPRNGGDSGRERGR
jgi:spore germination protein KA